MMVDDGRCVVNNPMFHLDINSMFLRGPSSEGIVHEPQWDLTHLHHSELIILEEANGILNPWKFDMETMGKAQTGHSQSEI